MPEKCARTRTSADTQEYCTYKPDSDSPRLRISPAKKYAVLNGDCGFFKIKIKALHRDWGAWLLKNTQFLIEIAFFYQSASPRLGIPPTKKCAILNGDCDFFNLKSKRFTVIGKPGGQKNMQLFILIADSS